MSPNTNDRQGADMSQIEEKRRIVDAIQAERARTIEETRRLRAEVQSRMAAIQQQCAESGGHMFTDARGLSSAFGPIGGRECLFCGAPEPRATAVGAQAGVLGQDSAL